MRLLIPALSMLLAACGSGPNPNGTEKVEAVNAFVDRTLSSTDPLYRQFWKIEQDRLDDGRLKNVDAVAGATADSYVQVDWQGNVLDKPAAMARIASSGIRIRSNLLEELRVRLVDDLVLVVARATRTGSFQGQDISDTVRYSRLYKREGNRWRVIFFQQTPVPAEKS